MPRLTRCWASAVPRLAPPRRPRTALPNVRRRVHWRSLVPERAHLRRRTMC